VNMARRYSRDARGRFSGGGSGTAPRTMKTKLARTVAPQGTIAKRKASREINRDAYKGKEEIGNVGPWILRKRPRRLPGGPLAPAKLRGNANGTASPVAAAGMRRRGVRTRRAT
jgi:hypothetical protein